MNEFSLLPICSSHNRNFLLRYMLEEVCCQSWWWCLSGTPLVWSCVHYMMCCLVLKPKSMSLENRWNTTGHCQVRLQSLFFSWIQYSLVNTLSQQGNSCMNPLCNHCLWGSRWNRFNAPLLICSPSLCNSFAKFRCDLECENLSLLFIFQSQFQVL